jgi:hypothetical protein
LTLIPWEEAEPRFYVRTLHDSDAAVRAQFSEAHVYYAGSHEGCGCGFQYGEYPEFEDEERPRKRASLNHFAEYLDREMASGAQIRIFACWEGDQALPAEYRRELTPNALRRDDFFFLQREILVMRGDDSAAGCEA